MLQPGDAFGCSAGAAGPAAVSARRRRRTGWRPGRSACCLGRSRTISSAEAWARLLASAWQVTSALDRMGLRLAGPALAHVDASAADIVSDGVVPGAIQVPADGQPIVLLADAQTVGGCSKIATVIRADLPRLAQARPGERLTFAAVDGAGARAALARLRARWQAWCGAAAGARPAASTSRRSTATT